MSGRYVLLEFDNKEDAEALVQGVEQGHIDGHRLHRLNGDTLRVTGMFMKPSKFCDCPDKRRQQANNWARGSRTGLYLCRTCRKPSIHHQRGIMDRLQYVFGWNLIGRD